MRQTLASIALGICLMWLTSCASGYNYGARAAHEAYYQGRYEEALKLIEKVKPSHKDELLYLMDKGMILHAAGEYKESNKILAQAEELSDVFVIKSVSREVAGTFWSEETIEYAGDKHERIIIPVIRMLNYIMLNDWDEALVEVRRLLLVAEKVYGSSQELENAFAIYISAVIWETLGQVNDALISYSRLQKHEKKAPYYGHDIKTTRAKLGLNAPLPPSGSLAWQTSKNYRKYKGELIVIAEAGRAPLYVSEYMNVGLYNISVPTVRFFPQYLRSAKVLVDGKEVGVTYPFYNIFEDIMIALKDRQKRSFVRKMIKIPVQTGLYAASLELLDEEDTESKIAGAGLGILALSMAISEKADERSWRTLPAELQIGRFYLKPGRHEIEIQPIGFGTNITREVLIEEGKPHVLLLIFPQSQAYALRGTPSEYEYRTDLKSKEKTIREEIRKDPKDGNAKINLAYNLMEQGNYNVESLLKSGLDNGGNNKRGIKGLIIVYMVNGKYEKALKWIDKGMDEKIASEDELSFYEEAAHCALDITSEPDISITPTEEKDINNAFNYYLLGLIDEKLQKYGDAAYNFMLAYKYGLIGEPIEQKLTVNFRKTDREFKESDRGTEIASQFSNLYLTYH